MSALKFVGTVILGLGLVTLGACQPDAGAGTQQAANPPAPAPAPADTKPVTATIPEGGDVTQLLLQGALTRMTAQFSREQCRLTRESYQWRANEMDLIVARLKAACPGGWCEGIRVKRATLTVRAGLGGTANSQNQSSRNFGNNRTYTTILEPAPGGQPGLVPAPGQVSVSDQIQSDLSSASQSSSKPSSAGADQRSSNSPTTEEEDSRLLTDNGLRPSAGTSQATGQNTNGMTLALNASLNVEFQRTTQTTTVGWMYSPLYADLQSALAQVCD